MTKNINELNRTEGANCEFNKLPFVDTTAIQRALFTLHCRLQQINRYMGFNKVLTSRKFCLCVLNKHVEI